MPAHDGTPEVIRIALKGQGRSRHGEAQRLPETGSQLRRDPFQQNLLHFLLEIPVFLAPFPRAPRPPVVAVAVGEDGADDHRLAFLACGPGRNHHQDGAGAGGKLLFWDILGVFVQEEKVVGAVEIVSTVDPCVDGAHGTENPPPGYFPPQRLQAAGARPV